MLTLTEETGQPVRTTDGRMLGRAVELVVSAGDPAARVTQVGVGRRRHIRYWVEWADIESFERSGVQLRPSANPHPASPTTETRGMATDELWIVRDVLDAQVLDSSGGRLVRVGDVVLTRADDGLHVVAVQFGLNPVLRRLGFRSLAERFATKAIDWRVLHLVSGRGLNAQLEARSDPFQTLSPAQLAALIAQLPTRHASRVVDVIGTTRAAHALSLAHPDVSARMVGALPHPAAAALLEELPSDDAVSALRSVDDLRVAQLLRHVHSKRTDELVRLLAAHPNTAAGLMSTDVRTAAVGDTIESIRADFSDNPPPLAGLANVFVVDDEHRPVGILDTLALITGRGEVQPVLSVPGSTPTPDAIDMFATQDWLALPVVDDDGRLIGVLAVDDVLEELIAERLPGRRRFAHLGGRSRFGFAAKLKPRPLRGSRTS